MTTTRSDGFDVAAIPADELSDKLMWLVSNLNPIDHMDCAALLMATCDLRTREALALSWSDADLDARSLNVSNSCDELGNPKPAKAARTVKLPTVAVESLRNRRAVQGRYFKRYAPGLLAPESVEPMPAPDSPIVSTPEGNRIRPKAFARWWHDKRCDFGMFGWTLSDLRRARMVASADAETGR